MKYILFIAISITCIQLKSEELSVAETLFLPDISQHITRHLQPDNLFLNYYQEKLSIAPDHIQIMRKKYTAKKNNLLWQIFKRFIQPLYIEHYQGRIPIDSAINDANTMLAVAYEYENAIIVYDIESDELTRRFFCDSIPNKVFFSSSKLFVACKNGIVHCIDIEKHETVSILPSTKGIMHISADELNIYTIDSDNSMSKTSTVTGETQITVSLRDLNVTTMHQQDSALYLGTQNGHLLVYHFDRAILDDLITIDGTSIVQIVSDNNGMLCIKTSQNTYLYNITTKEIELFTSNQYFSPSSMSSANLKLFKQYDMLLEHFSQTKSILPEAFYIGKIAFFNLTKSICAISDDKKITVLNLENIIAYFSLHQLQFICLLEESFQNSYILWTFIKQITSCCTKKATPILLQKEKWAEAYNALPTIYKKFIQKRYRL